MPTHFEGCEGIVRALNAYINLVRASDSVLSKIAVHLESEGVTMGQFAVLEAYCTWGRCASTPLPRSSCAAAEI